MSKNNNSNIFFWIVMSFTTVGSVACGDNSHKSTCYDALIEAGRSKYEASDFCYGPRD